MFTAVDEIKRHLKLIAAYFQYNLSAVMEYRTRFLVQVFGMVLNNASFIFFWKVVYARIPLIAGYSFEDVMFCEHSCLPRLGLPTYCLGTAAL